MKYRVISQEGMVVGSAKTREDALDLAEDIGGVIEPIDVVAVTMATFRKILMLNREKTV